jgi:NAD(P)-dependent dehydrogenase (short-subunit alcohol dehydrogenase family)
MKRLNGKVAVVLGAAGKANMGQAIARQFAAEGAKVVVAGRHLQILDALANETAGAAQMCDVTQKQDLDRLAQTAHDTYGRLDIAVNCTGWSLFKPFLDTTEDELTQMMNVQFKGPFQFIQAMASRMPQGGSIIQISSISTRLMLADHAAYIGTKAGAEKLVRAAANDLGSRKIRVNSISPGLTDTPMVAAAMSKPGFLESFDPYYPLGRIGTTADIAAAALWLASDECFMTGQNLEVDGGLSLRGLPLPQKAATK